MAQAGSPPRASLVPEIVLDDIGCTSKTMPEFEQLWTTMINDSVDASQQARRSRGDAQSACAATSTRRSTVRGRRSNRPRTKDRPDYADAETGMVDHGRSWSLSDS